MGQLHRHGLPVALPPLGHPVRHSDRSRIQNFFAQPAIRKFMGDPFEK